MSALELDRTSFFRDVRTAGQSGAGLLIASLLVPTNWLHSQLSHDAQVCLLRDAVEAIGQLGCHWRYARIGWSDYDLITAAKEADPHADLGRILEQCARSPEGGALWRVIYADLRGRRFEMIDALRSLDDLGFQAIQRAPEARRFRVDLEKGEVTPW